VPDSEKRIEAVGRLFVVADGMGGHEGGAVASRLAIDTLKDTFRKTRSIDPWTVLHDGFGAANKAVLETAESQGLRGMGTTLTAMIVKGRRAYIAHAGDSRCYRVRRSTIVALTEDHSFVNRLLKDGLINDEEAKAHSHRNVITNAVGMKDMRLQPTDDLIEVGDVFVLCTDGVHKVVAPETIVEIAEKNQAPQTIAQKLIDAAKPQADDNMTALVVRVAALSGDADPTAATPTATSPVLPVSPTEKIPRNDRSGS
jgi:protein phosphatase